MTDPARCTESFGPLDGTLFGLDQPCFGCGPQHPHGFRLRFVKQGLGVATEFAPTPLHQGAPGIMHGGLVSTVADETAAWAIIERTGRFGFTTSFECRFLRPVRVGSPAVAFAEVAKAGSRVVKVDVTISQRQQECWRGLFTFVLLDRAGAERLLERPLPEAWARFCKEPPASVSPSLSTSTL